MRIFYLNMQTSKTLHTRVFSPGQRDKPFVSESENELRTPRPDLKDRPYSADYSGESFRRHYQVSWLIFHQE